MSVIVDDTKNVNPVVLALLILRIRCIRFILIILVQGEFLGCGVGRTSEDCDTMATLRKRVGQRCRHQFRPAPFPGWVGMHYVKNTHGPFIAAYYSLAERTVERVVERGSSFVLLAGHHTTP